MNEIASFESIGPDDNRDQFRVLVVDDEKLYAQAISRELVKCGMLCDVAYLASEALERSQSGRYQAIILDHRLPDDDGIRLIPILLGRQPGASLLIMTAYETIDNAIQAIRQGAEDYIVKQISVNPVIDRAQEIRRRYLLRQQECHWEGRRVEGILGASAQIVQVREQLERVAARRDTTILLTGETGVGKEVAARHLHSLSSPDNPFVSIDCVALPGALVESLLFGHEKGAFTGAHQASKGAFEEAGCGIAILLDEIGDMDLNLQGKLLRVLENKRYKRVGNVQERAVKARIIAATNRDLNQLADEGRFRFDLLQRLSVFPVYLPPLREHKEDIAVLAKHFIDLFSGQMERNIDPLRPEIIDRLVAYDFPGNVRELRNVLERAVILSDTGKIELHHLPERILSPIQVASAGMDQASSNTLDYIAGIDTLETLEKKLIQNALEQTGGVKVEAAKLLGISRFQLLRRLEKYGRQHTIEENDQT